VEAGHRVLRRAAVWQRNAATATRTAGVAVGGGSARDGTVHVDHPCDGACRDLRLAALPIWAYSCRAVEHASIMHLSFAQKKRHESSGLFFVRNL
jgi:hypothetical protein